MEISFTTLSLSRPPHALAFSSSHSTLFKSSNLLNTTKNTLVLGKARRSRNERSRKGLTCNALFGLGVPELVVIAGVAALVFGPKKLPEVGKSIGKTVKSFQQAAKEFESELKKEPDSLSDSPEETPTEISDEKKQDAQVSSSKESV
ncbi:sec-independent protein translocase protein TATA, chloroplastic [Mercurialis annua]|uniref:sec-independent protein translocase protein TATA, chloroplastic n=1 Tax=Mercurialis annua TaxID=3986 RepID=UPI00215EC7A9|nr:sec-independent protein translocase protein TATA, chloroplastic [Mercurialis annua]